MIEVKRFGVGKNSLPSFRLEEVPPYLPLLIDIPLSGPGVASTSHVQDQGEDPGQVSPGRGQEGLDPEDPLGEQQEEHVSDSSVVIPSSFGNTGCVLKIRFLS